MGANMEESRSDIIAGIRELRAKAVAQLTGNEYYTIAQQLDAVEHHPELTNAIAQPAIDMVRERLNIDTSTDGAGASMAASGDPEIPETPGSPAEPDTPSTPEEPPTTPSPTTPDRSPGPEIPSPGTSPSRPGMPPETGGSRGSPEGEHIVTPRANSFGTPQPTAAINLRSNHTEVRPGQTSAEQEAQAPAEETGLQSAASAVQALAVQELEGNDYYMVANRLGVIRTLPGGNAAASASRPPANIAEGLSQLRQEAGKLSGEARAEAETCLAAIEQIVFSDPSSSSEGAAAATRAPAEPQSAASSEESRPETVAEAAAAVSEPDSHPQPTEGPDNESDADLPIFSTHASESGEPTTFDDLARASLQRVQSISREDPAAPARLNGAAAADRLTAPTQTAAAAPRMAEAVPEAPAASEPSTEAPVTASERITQDNQAPTEMPSAPAETPSEAPVGPTPDPVVSAAMTQDKGEAFNDGGSERRSSDHDQSEQDQPATVQSDGQADHTESSGEETAHGRAETPVAVAQPAETASLAEEAEAPASAEPETGGAEPGDDEVRLEAEDELDTSSIAAAGRIVRDEGASDAPEDDAPSPSGPEAEPVAEQPPVVTASEAGDTAASDTESAAMNGHETVGSTAKAPERGSGQGAETEPQKGAEKSEKKGFLSRLFGGSGH